MTMKEMLSITYKTGIKSWRCGHSMFVVDSLGCFSLECGLRIVCVDVRDVRGVVMLDGRH